MLNKNKKIVSIALVLILCLTSLTGCIGLYNEYRYPTAKEAMESIDYIVKVVYGEVELNGLICFFFSETDTGGGFVSAVLTKNKDGYCAADPYQKKHSIRAIYNTGMIRQIVVDERFYKCIIMLDLVYEGEKPEIIDNKGNEALIIETPYGKAAGFFVLKRIPKNYKICVNDIWYPIPEGDLDLYLDLPPQD